MVNCNCLIVIVQSWSCVLIYDPMNCSKPGFPVSNSCPLSWWYHPTISSSVTASLSALNLSQHQGLFQWIGSLYQVAKVLELQLPHQSFQWIFRVDFLYYWLVWSPCSPRNSSRVLQHHSLKASVLWHLAFFMVHLSHPYMTTGKTTVLTISWTLSAKWCLYFLICCLGWS